MGGSSYGTGQWCSNFASQFGAGPAPPSPAPPARRHRRAARDRDAELDTELDAVVYKRVGGLLIKDVGEMVV